MSDNASQRSVGELLDSLSPPLLPTIEDAAAVATHDPKLDRAATFMGDHTVVDYVQVVEEYVLLLLSLLILGLTEQMPSLFRDLR